MKKTLTITTICLLCFSMFLILTPQARATSTLPWKDDFNYATKLDMVAAGWTLGNEFMISVGGGAVTLNNNGQVGSEVFYSHFQSGIYDWRAESSGMWIGGPFGSIGLNVDTERHGYRWGGDGWDSKFVFTRDGSEILRFDGYPPQFNVWVKFAMEKRDNTVYMYYEDDLKYTYIETDDTPSDLTGVWLNSAWVSTVKYDYISVTSPTPPTVSVAVSIDPDALNLRSKGKWITAYIELPEGYDANDINVSSILLNDTIPAEPKPIAIGDYDNDGIPELMVKFNRAEVISYILDNIDIEERFTTVTLTITGYLYDGTPFEGSDTITIIHIIPKYERLIE